MFKFWTSSGETLSVGLVKQFYKLFPFSTLLNIYGSTEVAADVTCFDTGPMIINENRNMSILFSPISNDDGYFQELMKYINAYPIHNKNFDIKKFTD